MLSLRELRRASDILQSSLPGCQVKRIVQKGDFSLLFVCLDAKKRRFSLLLSCDQELARVCMVEDTDIPGVASGSFQEYAGAHLTGGVISAIRTSAESRQVCLEIETGSGHWRLYLCILGARSNIFLADGDGRLVHCMRSLEATRRDLRIGDLWRDPPGSAPGQGQDRWEDVPDEAYLETICSEYLNLELRRDALTLGRKIGQVLNKERTLLGRKLDRLHEDLAGSRQAEVYRRKGELLKTALHRIRPGDDCIEVTDHENGEVLKIAVDPMLSPAANLEAYFSRYHKDSRGERMIGQQVEKLQAQRDELDVLEARLTAALEKDPPDAAELRKMESLPPVRRLIGRYAPKGRREAAGKAKKADSRIPRRLQPKRFRTEDGLEIWVGRNDEGNDYLTTRLARGNDLFFHLEGYPGSHVILRTEGRPDPPNASLLDACELAVHFSRLKNAGSADVHVAPVKNIKKPKGAKPGLVYVRQGKTIRLRREPKRLERILASRIDV